MLYVTCLHQPAEAPLTNRRYSVCHSILQIYMVHMSNCEDLLPEMTFSRQYSWQTCITLLVGQQVLQQFVCDRSSNTYLAPLAWCWSTVKAAV